MKKLFILLFILLSVAQAQASYNTPAQGAMVSLGQSNVPLVLPNAGYMMPNGSFNLGTQIGGGTMSFSAASGSGVTATASIAAFAGTAADVGKVISISDTAYKTATITAAVSTTQATVTINTALSGTGPFATWQLGVPLPVKYVNIPTYFYMPANAISGSNAVGWYYVVCSTTTACTVYNNTYTPGVTPLLPSTPVAFSTSQTAPFYPPTNTTIYAYELPLVAGSFGVNDRFVIQGSIVSDSTSTTKSWSASLGAQGGGTAGYSVSVGTNPVIPFILRIAAVDSLLLQDWAFDQYSNIGVSGNSGGPFFSSINMANAQYWNVGLSLGYTTDYLILQDILIQQVKGVP